MKRNTALVMAGTADYAFAIANVLIGLEKYSNHFIDDVLIYHAGMSEHDMECINKIRSCKFIEYDLEKSSDFPRKKDTQRYSFLTYAKTEIFDLLNEYKNIIWLDADLIIQKNIEEILDYGPIGMTEEGTFSIMESVGSSEYAGSDKVRSRNTGVIIVNDSLAYQGLTAQCYQYAKKHWFELKMNEQSVINLVLYLNKIKITPLPKKFNARLEQKSHEKCIVHIANSKKFWSNGIISMLAPEWEENNKVWAALGGTPYQGKRDLWEFNDCQGQVFHQLIIMGKIYKATVRQALAELCAVVAAHGLAGVKVIHYTLIIPFPADAPSRYKIRLWGRQAAISLSTTDAAYCQLLKKAFAARTDTWKYSRRHDEKSGTIINQNIPMSDQLILSANGHTRLIEAWQDIAVATLEKRPDLEEFLNLIKSVSLVKA